MVQTLSYASVDTPTPKAEWHRCTDSERLCIVTTALELCHQWPTDIVEIVEAKQDGQIIVRLTQYTSAAQRGTLLLDLEGYLKATVDPGLAVWLEPLNDLSSLRNLRGITVKS